MMLQNSARPAAVARRQQQQHPARAAAALSRRHQRRPLASCAAAAAATPAATATAATAPVHLDDQPTLPALRPASVLPPPAPAPQPPLLLAPPGAFGAAVDAGAAKAALAAHAPRLLLLSALAGAYIGLGALLSLTVGGGCGGLAAAGSPGLQKLVAGAVGLPTGLLLVLACGGELVTGNLALCTAAALEGRARWGQVVRAWAVAYAGNVLGALAVVALAAGAGLLDPGAAAAAPAAAAAAAKCALPLPHAFFRGVLANWLVCLAVWMALAVRDLPSKFLAALLPVSAFVAMGAEHSVANAFVVPAGMAAAAIAGAGGGGGAAGGIVAAAGPSVADFVFGNLLPVTLGNAVGGMVCVALAYSAAFGRVRAGGAGGAGAAAAAAPVAAK